MLYYAAVPWDAALNVTRRMSVCPSVCPTLTVDSENGTPYNVSSNCQNHSEVKPSGGSVTFGRLTVSDSELGVDVIDFDECYCYLFTVLYCSLVLHAGPF